MVIFLKYYGLQYPKCKSWMVKEKNDTTEDGKNLECIEYLTSFQGKTVAKCRYCQILLYREDLRHIIKTGRCENFNSENELPEELVEYVKGFEYAGKCNQYSSTVILARVPNDNAVKSLECR